MEDKPIDDWKSMVKKNAEVAFPHPATALWVLLMDHYRSTGKTIFTPGSITYQVGPLLTDEQREQGLKELLALGRLRRMEETFKVKFHLVFKPGEEKIHGKHSEADA